VAPTGVVLGTVWTNCYNAMKVFRIRLDELNCGAQIGVLHALLGVPVAKTRSGQP
jgi:hypothetical protein